MNSSDDSPSTFPNGNGNGNGNGVDSRRGPGTGPDEPAIVAATSSSTPATRSADSPIPFVGLQAPEPTAAAPPVGARWLAFGSILVGGLLGGMIGYGTADLLADSSIWALVGLLIGALAGATGVGVVAALTLRAMNEWKATTHPEAAATTDAKGFELRPGISRRPTRTSGRGPGKSGQPRSGGPGTP